MRTFTLSLAIAMAIFCTFSSSLAQSFIGIGKPGTEWELEKESGVIKGYSRRVDGEQLKEFKVQAIVPVNFDSAVAVFQRPEELGRILGSFFYNWKQLEARPDGSFVMYYCGKTPVFSKDRDFITEYTFHRAGARFIVKMTGRPEMLPENEQYVRVPRMEMMWILSPLPDGTIDAILMGAVSPGGAIPDSFANRVMMDVPMENMRNFMREVGKSKK